MRDYDNMPVITWNDAVNSKKIEAQVHHAEPVIIEMPESFVLAIDATACGCKSTDNPELHIDCKPMETLKTIAEENKDDELLKVASIAHEAGQVVDVDTRLRRIVIHD